MKKINKKRLGIALFISLILVIVLYFGLFTGTFMEKVTDDNKIHVRMGLSGTPDILDIPYFIAQEKGFFEEEGLEVEYFFLNGDAIAIQALLSNSVDVTSSGHFAVINAINSGAEIKAFVSVQNSHDYVLSSSEDIKNLEGLKGKTIAIYAPGDITGVVTINILESHGISKGEVDWISVGGSTERYLALITKKADAAPLHADFGYKIEKEEGFHTLISIAKEQPLPMSVVSARTDFMQENPEIILKITRALIKSSRYATENTEGFLEVANKYLEGIEPEEISEIYDFLIEQNVYGVTGGITEESINNGINALVRINSIESPIPVEIIANFDFIKEANRQIEQY